MELILKTIGGGILGALAGLLFSRSRVCSSQACRPRIHPVLSVLSWAAFGAAMAWYFTQRTG